MWKDTLGSREDQSGMAGEVAGGNRKHEEASSTTDMLDGSPFPCEPSDQETRVIYAVKPPRTFHTMEKEFVSK